MQKIYVVGGYCRDTIIGLTPKDRDFVMVGFTPDELIDRGFKQVGSDFPVFLSSTGEEFALARTERKIAAGYHGFETSHDATVTLEDDLCRRDLRCNSIALEVDVCILTTGEFKTIGDFIDPYNGIQDIKDGVLRHTSDAFAEDPLRVLRVARFAARYNFKIAGETLELMRVIVGSGEMESLPMERVYVEFKKAMMEDHPQKFFDYLNTTDVLDIYFGELCDWNGIAFNFAVNINATFEERVVALFLYAECNDTMNMLTCLKAPTHLLNTVLWSCKLTNIIQETSPPFFEADNFTKILWRALEDANVWRNVEKLKRAAHVQLYEGEGETFTGIVRIMTAINACSGIGFADLDPTTRDELVGKEIGKAISQKRLEVIEDLNLYLS